MHNNYGGTQVPKTRHHNHTALVVTFFNHNFVNCKATLIWRSKIYEIKYIISLNDVHTFGLVRVEFTPHTHPFNGPFSAITWVSRYQKGKTNLHFTEARDSEWQ